MSGASFKNSDLHRIALWMHGINLSRADLSGLDLAYVHLESADLSGANLSNTCLWRASLHRANLSAANLSGCNLSGAKILETWFNCANLTSTDFRKTQKLLRVSFAKANFFGVDICEIERAIFANAYFKDTILPDGTTLSSDA